MPENRTIIILVLPNISCLNFEKPPLIIHFTDNVAGPIAFNGYYSLLVCVAIDRFCAVFFPLQFKIMRKKYICKMIAGVFVYVCVVLLSFLFAFFLVHRLVKLCKVVSDSDCFYSGLLAFKCGFLMSSSVA